MTPRKHLLMVLLCVCVCLVAANLYAAEAAPEAKAPETTAMPLNIWLMWALTPVGAVLALIFACVFYKQIMSRDEGTDRMREIAGYVRA